MIEEEQEFFIVTSGIGHVLRESVTAGEISCANSLFTDSRLAFTPTSTKHFYCKGCASEVSFLPSWYNSRCVLCAASGQTLKMHVGRGRGQASKV